MGFFVVYTDGIFLPWGISPLRSDDRPHSGRNDIIKPSVHNVISSVSREIPYNRNGNSRIRYAAGRGRPALPTATPRIGHNVISSVSREVSLRENGTLHIRASPLARSGSLPYTTIQTLASRGSLPRQPTCPRGSAPCPQGFPAAARIRLRKDCRITLIRL